MRSPLTRGSLTGRLVAGCCFIGLFLALATLGFSTERLRMIIETDAGGDPDDEQSLVRFLLYANEWDIEGIIANRPDARDGENLNPSRTGLGIVQRLLDAYGECHPNLVKHDPRYPTKEALWNCTVPGYNHTNAAAELIKAALRRPDSRPIWYSDWGTDHGAATNNMLRVLDELWRQGDMKAYGELKGRLRLVSYDMYGAHTTNHPPAFKFWVNTFQPPRDGKRWYHRFSALTAKAGGFDLKRDVLTGHGPLGALYPENTTHTQKEGDTPTFLYLVPTGMNDPEKPEWGSWAGRYGHNENYPGFPYYWANQVDAWNGSTNRDNTLARWSAALQNDFRARLDWCVRSPAEANHAPIVKIDGSLRRTVPPKARVDVDAGASTDPDKDTLTYLWEYYPEMSGYPGPVTIENPRDARATLVLPAVSNVADLHFILTVTDQGSPPLSRYQRLVVTVKPDRR